MTKRSILVTVIVLGLALVLGAGVVLLLFGDREAAVSGAFLDGHWDFPLEPQGPAPAGLGPREAALGAESCGSCHVQQHADWQTSRHSETMNAGIRWQFHVFSQADSNKCMDCHAPLAEQKALAARDMGWPNAPDTDPPAHIPPNLHREGLTCAACHVREHERMGPVHRTGLSGDEDGLPHGGFRVREEFSQSQFCAACHQFPEDGPRLNGKLRQDTQAQWEQSRFAEQGVTCQTCHMPERRHLWRGISDPDTLRSAMAVELEEVGRDAEGVDLRLRIENVGAGHHLPTYMVPRIDVRLVRVGPSGEVLEEVFAYPIQWKSSVDLATEAYDHRIPAGEAVVRDLRVARPAPADASLELRVDVAPKEFYERMYHDMLRQADRMNAETLRLLRIAIEEAEAARYRAIRESIDLRQPVALSLRPEDPPGRPVPDD